MGKWIKLLFKILQGTSDRNIGFFELCSLLDKMGFEHRVKGDHFIYYRKDIPDIINLQPKGSKAKPYQVKQVREMILKYRLSEEIDG